SFSCWIGTLGFVAYYFKLFSLVTVLANLLIVPLAALITLSGFSLIAGEFLLPWLSPLFAKTIEFLSLLLVAISLWLSKIPFAVFTF
ncbi:MAG: ComEC/Rec2 family competence protein, partial [Candidatus Omnitrophica bacterium]|nr:ComEC/Rec2 family competence protein [Candidatus Omnitrophota bacterium]